MTYAGVKQALFAMVLAGASAAAAGSCLAQTAPAAAAKPGSAAKTNHVAKTAPKPDPAFAAYQRGQFKTALDLAVARANKEGDAVAMVLAGEILSQGYGVRQDNIAARKWFEAAAAKGNADALFTLGAVQVRGGVQQKDDVVELLRLSAEKGNAAAAYNLGLIYLQGQVAPKEPAIAATWFQRAADKDQPDALYALATLYRDGNGVPRDPTEMARLLQQADAIGNMVATTEYAIAVFNGFGVPKDEERAAELFKKAALAGNAIAQNRLARLLSVGRGLPQDKIAAAAWHLAAKEQKLDDPTLDKFVDGLTPEERAEAERRFAAWSSAGRDGL